MEEKCKDKNLYLKSYYDSETDWRILGIQTKLVELMEDTHVEEWDEKLFDTRANAVFTKINTIISIFYNNTLK